MKTVRLGDICDIASGGTPSRSKPEYWQDGTIPWIKIGNIKGKHVSDADEYITQRGLDESSAKMLSKGTILYTIFATLGEVGILDIDACTNQAIAGITIRDPLVVQSAYLFYYLKSKKAYVDGIGRGVAQNNINMSILRNFKVPLPTIKMQEEIVSVLDKIEAIISARQQQLSALDDLIKARFVEMFGDPRTNPNGYEVEELRSSCSVITGNTPSRSVEEYYGDFIEWIKTDNIVSGRTSPTRAVECLSEEGMKAGRIVDEDAILMACIAGSIASIGRVCITDRKVAFNQQINAVIPKHYDVHFLYVLLQMSKDYLVEEINMALKGILSKSKLEDKLFYVPPMEFQKKFAAFVAQIDKSKDAIKKSLAETQTLFDSLMQEYFG